MAPTVLYLYYCPTQGDRIARVQALTFAGIRRYAVTMGWSVVAWAEARPETLASFLAEHSPVAGCVVESSDDNGTLPPGLFGSLPLVYLHAAPSLYGRRIADVVVDHEAVARMAFRELSAGDPEAYAVVGTGRDFFWSLKRELFFRSIVAEKGSRCRVFPHGVAPDARMRRLVDWVASLPRRTAVFAVNDYTAAEVVDAARLAGRVIPNDITLCGVDNDEELCEACTPTITSVQHDIERWGYIAAKLLNPRMRKGRGAVSVSPLMIERRESTCGSRRTAAPYILAAVERIRREACGGLTAHDVVASAPVSRSLFNLRFREAMGHSVHDEIEHVRLEKVFTLLSTTDTAIGAISDMCGYRSKIGLHKAFRLLSGMSMSEWRRRNVCK